MGHSEHAPRRSLGNSALERLLQCRAPGSLQESTAYGVSAEVRGDSHATFRSHRRHALTPCQTPITVRRTLAVRQLLTALHTGHSGNKSRDRQPQKAKKGQKAGAWPALPKSPGL